MFDAHGAFIARAIERLTGTGPHVDDLLQETFIIAMRKAHRFDAERAGAVSWLYGIAANLCRRHRRTQGRAGRFRSVFSLYAAVERSVEQPEQSVIRKEEIQLVRSAVDHLPFKQREVFVLFELEGMEGKDIGALLNLKEGTVWTRLHHARKSFKKYLHKRNLRHE